jgi:sec-independent protein translocase protein TatB
MLDMSFAEILVIGVVALIVIGPKRLPTVARTAGRLIGRMQRYVADVKSEVQREMDLEELRKIQGSIEGAARSVEASLRENMDGISQETAKLEADFKQATVDQVPSVDFTSKSMPVVGFGQVPITPEAETSVSSAVGAAGEQAVAPIDTVNQPDQSPHHQQELGFDSSKTNESPSVAGHDEPLKSPITGHPS